MSPTVGAGAVIGQEPGSLGLAKALRGVRSRPHEAGRSRAEEWGEDIAGDECNCPSGKDEDVAPAWGPGDPVLGKRPGTSCLTRTLSVTPLDAASGTHVAGCSLGPGPSSLRAPRYPHCK